METIKQFLNKHNNSFDSLLNDYDHEQPLYPYLVLITRENNLVINCSPVFWDWRKSNGFFLKQDRIIPNEKVDDSLVPQLYLKAANRYYSIYEEDKHIGITYTFYSKDACHKIYSFFDEGGEGDHAIKPFSYKKMLQLLGLTNDPEKVRKWIMENMIVEEEIVGMMTVQATPVFSSEKNQAVFVLLMKRPYEDQEPHIFDLYETFDFQKVYLQSKYLKSYSTKILVWAFVHDLKKGSDIKELCVMNDENNTILFEEYVRNHYESFSEEKKNECVMVFPDIYEKYIPSEIVYQRLLTDNIMSLASVIRRWGIGGSYAISSIAGDTNVSKLMVNVVKKIFNNKKQMLSLSQEYVFPLIAVLTYMNIMYNNNLQVKAPMGFWLYYFLFNYRKQCQKEDLPLINTLIAFTLVNNSSSFIKLINANKRCRCMTKVGDSSWATMRDESALFELVFYFSNECKGFWDELSANEQEFWPKRFENEMGYAEILQYLKEDGNHTWMGIADEREFYANKLYESISSELASGNFNMRECN